MLCFSPDKPHFASPWNASSERANEDDDDDLDVEEEAVSIRRLHWMAPQPPSLEGCLFAMLGMCVLPCTRAVQPVRHAPCVVLNFLYDSLSTW